MLGLGISSEKLNPCLVFGKTRDNLAAVDNIRLSAANDCAIVSKDSDFYQRSLLRGHPPKVLWIRRGNCSTKTVEEILRQHQDDIERFMLDPGSACLMLW